MNEFVRARMEKERELVKIMNSNLVYLEGLPSTYRHWEEAWRYQDSGK